MIDLDLHTRDILQINATVIAGGLIFLTLIGSALQIKSSTPASTEIIGTIILLITLLLFSMSSWIALRGQKNEAVDLMKWGFVFIFIFMLVILLIMAINDLRDSIQRLFTNTNQTITNQNVTNQTIFNQTKIG